VIESLLAYDDDGNVIATLDYMVFNASGTEYDPGEVTGLIDFAAHQAAGGEHTDIWQVSDAKGSKVWPEWLGSAAHDFTVELTGKSGHKQLSALVHKTSGHRRERVAIEAAIAAVEPDANGARDIRHIVGGPSRSLKLDADGKTAPRLAATGTPKHLPIIGR
jgi:hypothetical protein